MTEVGKVIRAGDLLSLSGNILVHADGGACHGTPLRATDGGGTVCPKCGIHPDMQSTEFWLPSKVKR